jgi:beta-lactamase class A
MNQLAGRNKFRIKKISPVYSAVFLVAGILFIAFALCLKKGQSNSQIPDTVIQKACPAPTDYRMKDFSFTNPLLLSDPADEAQNLQTLKHEIAALIDKKKKSGELISVAVHVASLNSGDWICINETERFSPGSLFKVPILMTFMREAEKNPALMEQKLFLSADEKAPGQTFNNKHIEPGKSYTVRELIYHMVVESDNYATLILNRNVNIKELTKFFQTIGLPSTNLYSTGYSLSVKEYSRLMTVLYNATYLYNEHADYALSLMAQNTFKEGMLKYLPAGIKAANRYGESSAGSLSQFHETGIIYLEDSPILINVMTKGSNAKNQANVISEISKLVYDQTLAGKVKS